MTTIQRSGTVGVAGGALWALLPVVFSLTNVEEQAPWTLAFVAVAVTYVLVGVVSLLMLLVGLSGLRRSLGEGAGRLARIGIAVSGVAVFAMFLGNGTELATIIVSGSESDLGHSVFLIGFLALIVGSVLLGVALLRWGSVPPMRWAAVLMVAMLPLGIGLVILGGIVFPNSDAGFWAGITVPYGLAWILLGRALAVPERAAVSEPARVS